MAAAQAAEIGDVPLDIEGLHKKMVTEPSGDGKEWKIPSPHRRRGSGPGPIVRLKNEG